MSNFIKKIYQSLDLRGNRLKNVRVDTPQETRDSQNLGTPEYDKQKDFVANKEYVDQVSKYDSSLVNRFQSSTTFDWVRNINGKTFKEVFDALLFGNKKPVYLEPSLLSVDVIVDSNNGPKRYDNKYLVFEDKQHNVSNNYEVEIQLSPGDRISNVASQLVFYNKDGVELRSINATDTNENIQKFLFGFSLAPDIKIVFKRLYNETSVVHNDSHGNPSEIENKVITFSSDITELFHKYISFETCYLYSSERITDLTAPTTNVNKLNKQNSVLLNANEEIILDVAIPVDNLKGKLIGEVYDNNRLITKLDLKLFESENKVPIDNIEYSVNRYYLGIFDSVCKLYLIRY